MDPKKGTMDYRKNAKSDEPIIEAIVESKPTFIPASLKRKMVKPIEPLA